MWSLTATLLVFATVCFANRDFLFSARRGRFSEVSYFKNYTVEEGDCVALVTNYDFPENCSQPVGLELSVRDSMDGEVWIAPRLHLAIVRRHTASVNSAQGRCLGQATYNLSITCAGADEQAASPDGTADE